MTSDPKAMVKKLWDFCDTTLAELGSCDDMLGVVFRKARNRIQILAPRRKPRRHRQPACPCRPSRRNRRRPAIGPH